MRFFNFFCFCLILACFQSCFGDKLATLPSSDDVSQKTNLLPHTKDLSAGSDKDVLKNAPEKQTSNNLDILDAVKEPKLSKPFVSHELAPQFPEFHQLPIQNRLCRPIYGKGTKDDINSAYFRVDFSISEGFGSHSLVFALYRFFDEQYIGLGEQGSEDFVLYCDGTQDMKSCPFGDKGFALDPNRPNNTLVYSTTVQVQPNDTFSHKILNLDTALYCIFWVTEIETTNYAISVELHPHSYFGHLPAQVAPTLILELVSLLIYGVAFIAWCAKIIVYWREILPVQKYITGVFAFVIVETFVDFYFLLNWNNNGFGSFGLSMASIILSSGRMSLSFFILLIVCMGYSVVKPTLGSQMSRCQLLTFCHFVFLSLYSWAAIRRSDFSGFTVLLIVLPLWLLMTTFYTMILTSLAETTQYLASRRQQLKLAMYRRLWYLIVFAAANFMAFFVVSMLWFVFSSNISFYAGWWGLEWVITSFWMKSLYVFSFLTVCYLWRPTKNNSHYGLEEVMSDPLEDEFDLDSSDLHNFRSSSFAGDFPYTLSSSSSGHNQGDVLFSLADSGDEAEDEGNGQTNSRARYPRSPTLHSNV